MDYNEYINLSHINTHKIKRYITNIKDDIKIEEEQIVFVALSYLAILYKEKQDIKGVKDMVENIYGQGELSKVRDYLLNLLEQNSVLVVEIIKNFSMNELLALALHVPTHRYSYKDHFETPICVSKLIIQLLKVENNDIVLDLGSGLGNFLFELSYHENVKASYGIENDFNHFVVSCLRSKLLNFPIKFMQEDVFKVGLVENIMADKVFSQFPFGMKFSLLRKSYQEHFKHILEYFKLEKPPHLGEWAFVLTALQSLKNNDGAKVVVLGSNGIINAMADKHIREYLVKHKFIEAVIAMPANILSFTKLETVVMVFSNNNKSIKMLDATNHFTPGRRNNLLEDKDLKSIMKLYTNNTENSVEVLLDEIHQNEYDISPQRYLNKPKVDSDLISLEDVIEDKIYRGMIIRSKMLSELTADYSTDIQYLELNNIENGKINSELEYMEKPNKDWSKYCVENKQLIISKTYPFKVAVVEKDNDHSWIATGNLYFMTIDQEKMDPYYLAAYLESEMGKAELERFSAGSVIRTLSISGLKKIKIPLLDRAKQIEIGHRYKTINDHILYLKKELNKNIIEKNNLF